MVQKALKNDYESYTVKIGGVKILKLHAYRHSGSQGVLFPNEKFPFERHGKRKKTSDGNFCGNNK